MKIRFKYSLTEGTFQSGWYQKTSIFLDSLYISPVQGQ